MRWVWDASKNKANLQKHGFDFEYASLVFDDPLATLHQDSHRGEERWHTMGMVGSTVIFVVHTWPMIDARTGDEGGRIISARKATKHERKIYEESSF